MTVVTSAGWRSLRPSAAHRARRSCRAWRILPPDLGRYIVEFAYDDIFARPGMDMKTRELAMGAALTATGTAVAQFTVHSRAALHVGASRQEIIETILQMIPYAGFPAALNAVTVARGVFGPE